jgi:dTDP-4-amino-4,6-dideoxygalactose transaminase
VGTIGEIGCFSLQQSKHITCGDGGLLATDDDDLAARARLFSDKGWDRSESGRGHLFLGMNYRITELQSAVVLAQLGKLDEFVRRRRQLGDLLTEKLRGVPGLLIPPDSAASGNTYWLYPVRLVEGEFGMSRDHFLVPGWAWLDGRPLYMQEVLREGRTFGRSHHPFDSPSAARRIDYGPGLCPNAERTLREVAALTVHECFSEADIADIAAAVQKIAEAARRPT